MQYSTALSRGSDTETQRELGGYLGKTLNLVSEALKTPEGAQRDDILATVWILTNYEVSETLMSCIRNKQFFISESHQPIVAHWLPFSH